ncbi:hypothetical protein M9799_05370 [Comamonas endophytica]|uniref:Uncharacterized protein n=1 Tax=Comamonas endophytica TaxID=2949090 RepID=A0ABY6GFW7_9BURK|nr:hypothetical protein M9799_05370 [Acidovorax sp. 5MLIR]
MARPPGGARLPAPGHPSARLCAKAAQAGIQARGLRAVPPADRPGQERSHTRADDGAGAVQRPDRRGHRSAGPARRAYRQRHLHLARRGRQPDHGARRGSRRRRHRRTDAARGPQRPLPLRQRPEIQAVPRQTGLIDL